MYVNCAEEAGIALNNDLTPCIALVYASISGGRLQRVMALSK